MQVKPRISVPAIFLVIFMFLANIATGLHYGFSIQPSSAFSLIYTLGFLGGLSWWLIDDRQKNGLEWLHSWGNFLYFAGWLVVPFYLFKTRGTKALLTILLFLGLYFGTYIVGVIAGVFISALMKL